MKWNNARQPSLFKLQLLNKEINWLFAFDFSSPTDVMQETYTSKLKKKEAWFLPQIESLIKNNSNIFGVAFNLPPKELNSV